MIDYGKVSIITPNYNCGRFVAESIKCVKQQTYQNWEMIIVDDCSSDNSVEVIKEYASADNRIILILNEKNSGAAVSRNKALKAAKGKWIAFLDSDDLWLPNKLERQLEFMVKNGYNFSYHEYTEIDEKGEELGISVSGINKVGKLAMYSCCWPGCLAVMYNHDKVGIVQINDIRRNNDTAIWLKIVEKYPCFLLKENLARYRRRRNSITTPSLWDKIRAHYPLFRKGCEMNPGLATFWTLINVLGNGYKKMQFVRRTKPAINKR